MAPRRNLQFRVLTSMIFLVATLALGQTGLRIKMVSRTTGAHHLMDASDQTTTTYVQGPNSRIEWPVSGPRPGRAGAKMVVIQRCADHVMFTLNLDNQEYSEFPRPGESPKDNLLKQGEGPPNLFIEKTVRDTGETKSAFGHTARHYITTTKQTSSPELGLEPSETVEDAWYLDIPDPRTCTPRSHPGSGFIGVGVGGGGNGTTPVEKIRPEFKYSGPDPQGLILSSKRTNTAIHALQTGEKQKNQFTTSTEVVDVSEEHIDPNLFQVPSGFKKVSQLSH